MVDCILRVAGLTKRYGDLLAVDRLDLEVRRGEILGFLGPNGAGKTTTLKMMCGLLRPDAGQVEIEGKRLREGQSLSAIGVSPQNLVLWNTLTCAEQLEFAGRMYDLPRAVARERARTLLRDFGLEDKAHRMGRTLSGGMQRRLNIALALVHGPRVLFLDEPQAGLDPQSRVLVREYLQSLRGQMTVIVTTHDMEEAEKLADRVCIMDRGKLLALDSVAGITRDHGAGALTAIQLAGVDHAALAPVLERFAAAGLVLAPRDELHLRGPVDSRVLAELLQELARAGLGVTGLQTRSTTLEDVFIRLTGRSLRE